MKWITYIKEEEILQTINISLGIKIIFYWNYNLLFHHLYKAAARKVAFSTTSTNFVVLWYLALPGQGKFTCYSVKESRRELLLVYSQIKHR